MKLDKLTEDLIEYIRSNYPVHGNVFRVLGKGGRLSLAFDLGNKAERYFDSQELDKIQDNLNRSKEHHFTLDELREVQKELASLNRKQPVPKSSPFDEMNAIAAKLAQEKKHTFVLAYESNGALVATLAGERHALVALLLTLVTELSINKSTFIDGRK